MKYKINCTFDEIYAFYADAIQNEYKSVFAETIYSKHERHKLGFGLALSALYKEDNLFHKQGLDLWCSLYGDHKKKYTDKQKIKFVKNSTNRELIKNELILFKRGTLPVLKTPDICYNSDFFRQYSSHWQNYNVAILYTKDDIEVYKGTQSWEKTSTQELGTIFTELDRTVSQPIFNLLNEYNPAYLKFSIEDRLKKIWHERCRYTIEDALNDYVKILGMNIPALGLSILPSLFIQEQIKNNKLGVDNKSVRQIVEDLVSYSLDTNIITELELPML